jgi:hypothetical protein
MSPIPEKPSAVGDMMAEALKPDDIKRLINRSEAKK